MNTAVEILVAGESAKQRIRAALGPSQSSIRFTGLGSSRPRGPQMLVALSSELRSSALNQLMEKTASAIPLVLLIDATMPATFGREVVQWVARWSARRRQEPFLAASPDVMRRLVLARKQGATKALIASAELEGENMIVWSCEPRRYEFTASELPALAKMTAAELADFAVSDSGSRIHWNQSDVDINMDTIRAYADPATRQAHEKKARKEAARYAKAIRAFREEKGLRQGDIAGLGERQVRRLESGECIPQIESLRLLAAAHGMGTSDYLGELARRSSSARRRAPARR